VLAFSLMHFTVFLTGGWNSRWLGRKAASFDRRVNGMGQGMGDSTGGILPHLVSVHGAVFSAEADDALIPVRITH
jgi:hypothetical protein